MCMMECGGDVYDGCGGDVYDCHVKRSHPTPNETMSHGKVI